MENINITLLYLIIYGRLKPILKWEIVKKCIKYKAGDKYCHLCMEEKIAIVTFLNNRELLNQRSEVLNSCIHKKKHVFYVTVNIYINMAS